MAEHEYHPGLATLANRQHSQIGLFPAIGYAHEPPAWPYLHIIPISPRLRPVSTAKSGCSPQSAMFTVRQRSRMRMTSGQRYTGDDRTWPKTGNASNPLSFACRQCCQSRMAGGDGTTKQLSRDLTAQFGRQHEMHILLGGLHGFHAGVAPGAQSRDDALHIHLRHGGAR